ncbi:TRAP transporter small permease [Chelativorans sp. Marseille-P2723]|uniref:TRAP transporter small permease subunit n=1 Tax=Chelativorans sp. Marseille-P2723 TaxID=2709133 RepID=UPI00156FCBE7|nr:TRAP transporter small permease [Chelativorans sp. Marseille-P2723]
MNDTLEKAYPVKGVQRRLPALLRPVLVLADRISWISSICLLTLAGLVIADVIGRSFGSPLSGGSDIGAMLMVSIVFFAMAGTQATKDHVSMDALVSAFPRRLRLVSDRVNLFVCLLIGIFLTNGTVRAAIKSYGIGEMALGGLRLPLWPAKSIVAFGFALYTLVLLAQLLGSNFDDAEPDSVPPHGAD